MIKKLPSAFAKRARRYKMSGKIQGFPYSANKHARVLILGSMPGEESLRQNQYYAHPRNLFWEIMGELFGAEREIRYEKRLKILRAKGIALWDVAHSCHREGSLDSNMANVAVNDFASLFKTAPKIHIVFFNGQTAAALFRKLVLPKLDRELKLITLPSTSPANAAVSIETKRAAWAMVQREISYIVRYDTKIL